MNYQEQVDQAAKETEQLTHEAIKDALRTATRGRQWEADTDEAMARLPRHILTLSDLLICSAINGKRMELELMNTISMLSERHKKAEESFKVRDDLLKKESERRQRAEEELAQLKEQVKS
jgi:hypothetical protein